MLLVVLTSTFLFSSLTQCRVHPGIPEESLLVNGSFLSHSANVTVLLQFTEELKTGSKLHFNSVSDISDIHHICSRSGSELVITISNTEKNIQWTIHVQKNSELLTKNLVYKYYSPKTGKPLYSKISDHPEAYSCFYNGVVGGFDASFVSLSFSLHHGIQGIIELGGDHEYTIATYVNDRSVTHVLKKNFVPLANLKMKCGTTDPELIPHHFRHKHVKREIRLPAGSNMETRFIEIYAVADNSVYKQAGSVDAAMLRVINIINYASGLYRMLNIYLALVGIEVWNDRNKIPYKNAANSSQLDSGMLLSEFNKYRHFYINFETPNDNAQLFTGERFYGGLIGKGSTRGICTQTDSGGVTYDGDVNRYVRAATTMAHELGHNLGLVHSDSDEYFGKDCNCPHEGDPDFDDCIMHSSANPYKQPRKWSRCTVASLRKYFTVHNIDYCLKNVPEKLVQVGKTPVCGNMFVEPGEECDCGFPADCKSNCCDPTSCKLYNNATCATGPCCDLDTCAIRPKSYLCRSRQDLECDLEEFCPGDSEWCPEDTYKHNGVPCHNMGDAHCHDGKCASYTSQCHFIWADGAKKSDDVCYEDFNNHSSYYGNCGWKPVLGDYNKATVEKQYLPCQTDEDKFCGLLHCTKNNIKDLKPMILNFPLLIYRLTYKGRNCLVSSFDVGHKAVDPGQVPNGAICADGKMCSNSRCVRVPKLPADCSCQGRGVCNQKMECHCDVGWAPPFCKDKGFGGSITSNPVSVEGPNIQLIVGLVTFFGGVVPITVILVLVGYFRRAELKRLMHRILGRYRLPAAFKPPTQPQHLDVKTTPIKSIVKEKGSVKQDSSGDIKKKANISLPVLQSSTNKNASSDSHMAPVAKPAHHRAAPPPPQKPSSNVSSNNDQLYENVIPRPQIKLKPVPPTKTSGRPPVPPKPR